ncbi:unnamed protein product [Meganyctiphanes norvegica]|uniref:Uncharacterized protein n=1 Tax=Meganyctiphanes norvegica TaxID=48144 RepID=A0AAV2S8L4_MEGNR
MASSFCLPVPALDDYALYEDWREDILKWCSVCPWRPSKQAIVIHFALTGRAKAASHEIPNDDLQKKDGVQILLAKLDSIFLLPKIHRKYNAYHNMHNLRRKPGTQINEFIVDFEIMYYRLKRENVILTDEKLGFTLLTACRLSEEMEHMVLSTFTDDITYATMKAILQKVDWVNSSPQHLAVILSLIKRNESTEKLYAAVDRK